MINSLYLHIPYCKSRCIYCDFYTHVHKPGDDQPQRYVQALTLALKRLSRAGMLGQLGTVYIGGGTPSYLQSQLVSLIYNLTLMIHVDRLKEFTVECNPESFNFELFKDLRALGVDRYSLGVQSFNEEELSLLGRAHGLSEVDEVLSLLAREQQAVSIDLICGLPQQSFESFQESLKTALSYSLEHISIYPLTVEDGTPLAHSIACKKLAAPDEDMQADMLMYAHEILTRAGYEHYELSNYAKPGTYAKHNLGYWQAKTYLGLGPHASSMMNIRDFEHFTQCFSLDIQTLKQAQANTRIRFSFADTTEDFIAKLQPRDRLMEQEDGVNKAAELKLEFECLPAKESLLEDLMLSMRTQWGINVSELNELLDSSPSHIPHAQQLKSELLSLFDELVKLGLAYYEESLQVRLLKPYPEAWLVGNEIFSRIWDIALRV